MSESSSNFDQVRKMFSSSNIVRVAKARKTINGDDGFSASTAAASIRVLRLPRLSRLDQVNKLWAQVGLEILCWASGEANEDIVYGVGLYIPCNNEDLWLNISRQG